MELDLGGAGGVGLLGRPISRWTLSPLAWGDKEQVLVFRMSRLLSRVLDFKPLTWMICAACSGVPWHRSCSLTARTRSLLLSLPSLAARPPSSRSNTKTPDSSVRRTSLMPSCSAESRLCRVILSVLGLDGELSGVEQGAWGTAGVEDEEDEEGGAAAREAQRRSLSTVSCRVVQGRSSVERANPWGTLLMSTLLTWSEKHIW